MAGGAEDVGFEQDAEGLYVRLAGVARLRIVDCHVIDDWGPDAVVLLRCSRAPASDAPADNPEEWEVTYRSNSSIVWRNKRTGETRTEPRR